MKRITHSTLSYNSHTYCCFSSSITTRATTISIPLATRTIRASLLLSPVTSSHAKTDLATAATTSILAKTRISSYSYLNSKDKNRHIIKDNKPIKEPKRPLSKTTGPSIRISLSKTKRGILSRQEVTFYQKRQISSIILAKTRMKDKNKLINSNSNSCNSNNKLLFCCNNNNNKVIVHHNL